MNTVALPERVKNTDVYFRNAGTGEAKRVRVLHRWNLGQIMVQDEEGIVFSVAWRELFIRQG